MEAGRGWIHGTAGLPRPGLTCFGSLSLSILPASIWKIRVRQTGKPAGGDLTEGKKTVLWSLAEQLLGEDARANLHQVFGNRAASEEQISAVTNALHSQGVRDQHRQLITEYAAKGDALVASGEFDDAGREALLALGRALVERES